MGIYDREYYRDGSRGFRFLGGDWSATKILVAINVAVFIAQWVTNDGRFGSLGGPITDLFYASHDTIIGQGQVWRLVTYAFLHGTPFHLLFNMLFLWMAGREVEHIYGKTEFFRMYLAACFLAGLTWLAIDTINSPGFQGSGSPMLGASGAVAAVLVIFAMYYPQREVLLFFIVSVPIWLFVVVFLGLDLLGLLGELRGRGDAAVAFSAHLGGAAYGFLYKMYDLQWGHLGRWFARRPKLKVYRPESPGRRVAPSVGVTSRAGSSKSSHGGGSGVGQYPDEHLDAKVDEILAKIAREGRSGLTDEENRILQEASLRARNRRGERL